MKIEIEGEKPVEKEEIVVLSLRRHKITSDCVVLDVNDSIAFIFDPAAKEVRVYREWLKKQGLTLRMMS